MTRGQLSLIAWWKATLASRIERARRLVEEQQPGLLQQDAGDDELLLLPAGQNLVPDLSFAAFVAEMFDELAETCLVQRGRDPDIVMAVRRVGQADEFLQRELRQLHVLRRVEGLHALGEDDVAAAIAARAR